MSDDYDGHVVVYKTKRAADRYAAMYTRRMVGEGVAYVVKVGDAYQVRFRVDTAERSES